ncbi:hypothetical protein [Prauserella flavalba]|uniref:hypothetical protein n=1 Tax=Prauserella flavalba TaxID=1477506 RepID=UPI001FEB35AA|nr:hypothetical protein [Prauserella flavalba]
MTTKPTRSPSCGHGWRWRSVDAGAVEAFRQQVDYVRRGDRQVGGITLLDQLHSLIK